jgi:hypothetical protein
MKILRIGFALAIIALLFGPSLAQEIDPAWYGTWNLNLERSMGQGGGWAKQSRLLFTPRGWVETAVGRNGELAGSAIALMPGGACILIAPGPEQSCAYRFVDRTHIVVTLKGPSPMAQTVDIRLLPGGATVEVVVKGTDFYGRPVSSMEVWEKVSPSPSKQQPGPPNNPATAPVRDARIKT